MMVNRLDEVSGLGVLLAINKFLGDQLDNLNEDEARYLVLEEVKVLKELSVFVLGYWCSEMDGDQLLDSVPDTTHFCEIYRYPFTDQSEKCILCPLFNTGASCKQPANLLLRYRFVQNPNKKRNIVRNIIKEITKRSVEIDDAIEYLDPDITVYVDSESTEPVTENEWN